MNSTLLLAIGGVVVAGALFMSKDVIGSTKDNYADEFDPFFLKYARKYGIDPVLVKAVSANESQVGRYKGLEPIGGTTGIMHIKLATAQMFNSKLTAAELAKPETEIDYAVHYLKWLWDRYARFDTGTRTRYTVMAYNGGPGRVDELIKKGESAVAYEAWFKNITTYWNKYAGHVKILNGNIA